MTIIEFIQKNFEYNNSTEEIMRCIAKATYIFYNGKGVVIADDEIVYYLGCVDSTYGYKWYRKNRHVLKGKKAYTYNKKLARIMAEYLIDISDDGRYTIRIR